MAGTINSLGIGSGVLTADLIEKLKENERTVSIKPMERRIEATQQKNQTLELITSLMEAFQSSAKALANEGLYLRRSASSSDSGVGVNVSDGVNVQDFSIGNVSLAKKGVLQSGLFSDTTSAISSSAGTISISVGQKSYEIDSFYDHDNNDATSKVSHTLESLRDAINEQASDDLIASILKVNDNAYSLVLSTKKSGADQNISVNLLSGAVDSKLISDTQTTTQSYAATNSTFSNEAGSLTINIDGSSYTMAYDATTTITDIANAINNGSFDSSSDISKKLTAQVVRYAENDYRLSFRPKAGIDSASLSIIDDPASGTPVAISLDASGGAMKAIQDGANATFTYNGIEMERSSNTIDDIIVGVTLTLQKEGANANISITQDTDAISKELENFSASYNSLTDQIGKATLYDKEKGVVGLLIGESSITSITREINRVITSFSPEGTSLVQYGISLLEDGKMSFSLSDFRAKINESKEAVQKLFSGYTDPKSDRYIEGVFKNLDSLLDGFVGQNGTLSAMRTQNTNAIKSLESEYAQSVEMLEKRYDTLAARFAAYDSMINKFNTQFSVLQNMINAELNAKE